MNRVSLHEIKIFQESLIRWYTYNKRKFPWRKAKLSNYQIIIAEILLQRTKAETILKFYPIFLEKFPTWKSIKSTQLKTVEKILQPIGLYKQKARLLKKLAKKMVEQNGRLPKTKEEIKKLPFVGQYITNAIFLLIKKQPAPLLDVNMARVLERYFGPRKMSDIRYDPYLQKLAWRVVYHEESKKINWGILDFAALICLARNPKCNECNIKYKCFYHRENL